jgi:hypothetical protein
MNRIERNGRTYPAWFDSDSHLAELVRGAEQKRSQLREAVEIGAAWIGLILACGVIWYGVLSAAIGAL